MKTLVIILLTLVSSSQVFAQEDILTMFSKKYYYYQGDYGLSRILKSEIKELVYSTGDPDAFRYYSNYETGREVAIGSIIGGAVFQTIGLIKLEQKYTNYTESNRYITAAIVLYGIGVIALVSKKKSLKNAFNRVLSLQQQTKLEFGGTRNGFGLTYNF